MLRLYYSIISGNMDVNDNLSGSGIMDPEGDLSDKCFRKKVDPKGYQSEGLFDPDKDPEFNVRDYEKKKQR